MHPMRRRKLSISLPSSGTELLMDSSIDDAIRASGASREGAATPNGGTEVPPRVRSSNASRRLFSTSSGISTLLSPWLPWDLRLFRREVGYRIVPVSTVKCITILVHNIHPGVDHDDAGSMASFPIFRLSPSVIP